MFNSSFNELTQNYDNYYPENQQEEIDELNELIYNCVNNGVYRVGFAKTQEAYDKAVTLLFETLDQLEVRLEHNKFLLGSSLTEADLRLYSHFA